jgi:hypothetical protein
MTQASLTLAALLAALAAPALAADGYVPVVTPNGSTLPFTRDGDVKVFHLVAEPVQREFAPGLVVNCWGYNGQTPGPTIEAVEGDRVRILVTNNLPEGTSVHWHGILLPNGMDGVSGLLQPRIEPGETWAYEFTLRQHGTFMYHPHADEMTQIALGMEGFFIIHPREGEPRNGEPGNGEPGVPESPPVDRDFAIFLQEWFIPPGAATPDTTVMTDFNTFTMNSRVFPGTDPIVVRTGQRVRIRLANLSMDSHPIHIHGYHFEQVGTDGGDIPPSARFPETTVNVPVGTTRTIEFTADVPGDWPFHCHKSHHAMNGMAHGLPNLLGVSQSGVAAGVQQLLPDYTPMGESGMGEMAGHMAAGHMRGPDNTLPMASPGPYDPIDMGGMFTVIKVRDGLTSFEDPGWYDQPEGTSAWKVSGPEGAHLPPAENEPHEHAGHEPATPSAPAQPAEPTAPAPPAPPAATLYTCPMHASVVRDAPGKCPKCGMDLVPRKP